MLISRGTLQSLSLLNSARTVGVFLLLFVCLPLLAKTPQVVVTIAPIHSLVVALMEGVATPELLFAASQSPHHAALKPSLVRKIYHADVLIMIDSACFERQLLKLAAKKTSEQRIQLLRLPGLHRLLTSTSGHDPASEEQTHDCRYDAHVWLDPRNAVVLVKAIGALLMRMDDAHAPRYQRNMQVLLTRLQQLDETLAQRVSRLSAQPYLMWHNAYRYFERRYGLQAISAVLSNPEVKPGIKRIRQLRVQVARTQVRCLFIEPQFAAKLVAPIIAGFDVSVITLDPLGAQKTPGKTLYFELLDDIVAGFADCSKRAAI